MVEKDGLPFPLDPPPPPPDLSNLYARHIPILLRCPLTLHSNATTIRYLLESNQQWPSETTGTACCGSPSHPAPPRRATDLARPFPKMAPSPCLSRPAGSPRR